MANQFDGDFTRFVSKKGRLFSEETGALIEITPKSDESFWMFCYPSPGIRLCYGSSAFIAKSNVWLMVVLEELSAIRDRSIPLILHEENSGFVSDLPEFSGRTFDVSKKYKLYFIGNDFCIKIGLASDVERRLKQLQTGSAEKLRIVHVQDERTRYTEYLWHDVLKDHRMEGEWFAKSAVLNTLRQCGYENDIDWSEADYGLWPLERFFMPNA